MDFACFGFIQCWLSSLYHGFDQRVRQWVRPDSDSLASPGKRRCSLRCLRRLQKARGLRSHSPVTKVHCHDSLADAMPSALPCPRSIEGTATVCHTWALFLCPTLGIGLPRPTEWSCPVLSSPMPLNRVRSLTVFQPR